MKLIECNIAGFGTFNDFKLSFDEGLNVILQPNGWGKTTVAAYIKAMLYGFDRKKTRDVSENERLRYKPWTGTRYGGTLDFEFGGREYRIVRSFGATARADTLKVVDIASGEKVDLKGKEPGEWVFDLDCAAFQKSVFVGQNGFAFDGSTAGLRNRLNAFVNEVDDVAGLDSAKAVLDERRKFYIKTGNRGRIADISRQMAGLVEERGRQDKQVLQVEQLHKRLLELDGQAARLGEQAQAAQAALDEARKGASDLEALNEVRSQLVEQERQARLTLEEYNAQAGTIPQERELQSLRKAADSMARHSKDLSDATARAQEAQAALTELGEKYAGHAPKRSDIEACRAQLAAWRDERDALANAEAPADEGKYAAAQDALAADPHFLEHAEAAVNEWPGVASKLEQAREAQMRLDVANATWRERKASLESLVANVQRCEDAVPADADAQVAGLETLARTLRGNSTERDLAQTRLAEAKVAQEQAEHAVAQAQAKVEAESGEAKASPAGIVLAVLGIAAAVAGFVLLEAPVSYAAAAVGAVLVVIGIVLYSKAQAQTRAKSTAQEEARKDAQTKEQSLTEAKSQVDKAQSQLVKLGVVLERALASAGFDPAMASDCPAALAQVEEQRCSIERAVRDAADARERLAATLGALQSGKNGTGKPQKIADPLAAAQTLLKSQEAPGTEADARIIKKAQAAYDAYRASLAPFARAFGVSAADDPALVCERLKQAVASFEGYREQVLAAQQARQDAQRNHDQRTAQLNAWAASMGVAQGVSALTDKALDAMIADAEQAERLAWQGQQAAGEARQAQGKVSELATALAPVLNRFNIANNDDLVLALDAFAQKAARRDDLAQRFDIARDQLASWDKEHAADLEAARKGTDPAKLEQLSRAVDLIARQREEVAAERARCQTERGTALKSLESYLAEAQQLSLLSREKQVATSNLFTIQKTAEYLDRARGALDGRYLGSLTNRFNDYTASWLDTDEFDVDLDGDFDVSVSEDGSTHDVASYSTGYQDILDVCLRMALVDTVFETEQPFIVMDDPFVNLDQAKLGRALILLALLSGGKQIIYFTCHPSRTEAGEQAAGDVAAQPVEFTLPAQRASRELPRARAKREAEERARAQAELVASYHVVPVTQGRAAICPADTRRLITGNMVNTRFALSPDAGGRDNAFDVHFIDAQGRSLCERQTVEVIDGRVVPERVCFCLTTRPDSGDAYDLIVHEHDKPACELAARIPFKAGVAFSNEDFGF